METKFPYSLPQLPYSYGALEPVIDAQTMEIHHQKHHGAYVANLNKAVEEHNLGAFPLAELLKNVSSLPPAVRNNGGGHYNHSLFWQLLAPGENKAEPQSFLREAIGVQFGSLDQFKAEFEKAATGRFGSGWAWLIVDEDGQLAVTSTPNQDNPLMDVAEKRGTPILGLDVWEHAYYLRYQNRRAEYTGNWWNVLDWNRIAERYAAAKAGTLTV